MNEANHNEKVQDVDVQTAVSETAAEEQVADAQATVEAPTETVQAEDTVQAADAQAADAPVSDALAADESDTNESESEEESFRQMFEASLREQPVVKRGEMIKGMVVGINSDAVIIDVGAKAEGSIPIAEFEQVSLAIPAVGDEVDALVQSVGGTDGVRLSVLAARQSVAWSEIEHAQAAGACVDGLITSEVKGGFRVNLNGLNAFMPRSEADTDFHADSAGLIGQSCKVAILEARRKPDNIVVSRKRPMAVEQEAQKAVFFEQHGVGDKVSGTVKRMARI